MNAAACERMVQAIIDAHGADLAVQRPVDAAGDRTVGASALQAGNLPSIQTAALRACLHLGFDQADAEIVAAAWQAQSLRTGKFDTGLWPTHAADFGLLPWPRTPSFAECPRQLGLYVVAPDAQWVGRLAQAGAPTVQLRFKSANASAVEEQITASVDAVQGTSSRLFINDHWQQAIAAGAYGVHLGQEDLDDADLAAIRQSGLRLGISTHGYAEMLRADKLSPSYVAMGAVYPTTLKRMQTPPQGPGRLRMYARLMQNHPLVAIGGIDFERLDQVLASGVGSVAVVRAIVAANDPESEVHRWAVRMASSQNL